MPETHAAQGCSCTCQVGQGYTSSDNETLDRDDSEERADEVRLTNSSSLMSGSSLASTASRDCAAGEMVDALRDRAAVVIDVGGVRAGRLLVGEADKAWKAWVGAAMVVLPCTAAGPFEGLLSSVAWAEAGRRASG